MQSTYNSPIYSVQFNGFGIKTTGLGLAWWSSVKTPPSSAGEEGTIPHLRTETPHAAELLRPPSTSRESVQHSEEPLCHRPNTAQGECAVNPALGHFCICRKKSRAQLSNSSLSPWSLVPPAQDGHWTTSCLCRFVHSGYFRQVESHIICGLLWLDSFTYIMMFTRFFHVSVLHFFLFNCMDLPHFIYSSSGHSNCFQFGAVGYWEYLCTSFCVFLSYLGTHLGVESLPTLTIWRSDYNPCVHWCLSVEVGDGQGGLACCNSWGHKESDMTEWLNRTERPVMLSIFSCAYQPFIHIGPLQKSLCRLFHHF